MHQMTISQVTRKFQVSTRMLRYYEQIGLLTSQRTADYAYRVYDHSALLRLQKILILRNLRIPLKQIKQLLDEPSADKSIAIFKAQINHLDNEITMLKAVRKIMTDFMDQLSSLTASPTSLPTMTEPELFDMMKSLSLICCTIKEDNNMEEVKQCDTAVLHDVRIIYLPPCYVAAAHHIGDEPEQAVNQLIDHFVIEHDLIRLKPDLRHFGFNHPNPIDETGYHGYEMWVTIPEDLQVEAPLTKKYFPGGLYAAHMIPMGNFQEWDWLFAWVKNSDKYCFAGDLADQQHMCGLLEEHLNYLQHVRLENSEPDDLQLDLLMPVIVNSSLI